MAQGEIAERSALLALMDGAPDWAAAEPLLSDEEGERLLAIAAAFDETNEDDERENDIDRPIETSASARAGARTNATGKACLPAA